jgi:hypothetical protein
MLSILTRIMNVAPLSLEAPFGIVTLRCGGCFRSILLVCLVNGCSYSRGVSPVTDPYGSVPLKQPMVGEYLPTWLQEVRMRCATGDSEGCVEYASILDLSLADETTGEKISQDLVRAINDRHASKTRDASAIYMMLSKLRKATTARNSLRLFASDVKLETSERCIALMSLGEYLRNLPSTRTDLSVATSTERHTIKQFRASSDSSMRSAGHHVTSILKLSD